jgi:hypothetical protein
MKSVFAEAGGPTSKICTGFEEFIAREKILFTSVWPMILEKSNSAFGAVLFVEKATADLPEEDMASFCSDN